MFLPNGCNKVQSKQFSRPVGDHDRYLKEDENGFSSEDWKLGEFIELYGKVRKQIKLGMKMTDVERLFNNFPSMRKYTYRRMHVKNVICDDKKREFFYDRIVIYQDNSGTTIDRNKNIVRESLREVFTLSTYYKDEHLVHYSAVHQYLDSNDPISGPQTNYCYLDMKRERSLDFGSDSIMRYHIENIETYNDRPSNMRAWSFIQQFLGDVETKMYKDAVLGQCRISFDYVEDVPKISCANSKYNRYLSDLAAFELEKEGLWRFLPMETDSHFYLERISDSEIRISISKMP